MSQMLRNLNSPSMRIATPTLAALIVTLGLSSLARADGTVMVRGHLGLGGEVNVEDNDADTDTSFGLGLLYEARIHEYFALAVGGRFISWIGEDAADDDDRNALLDLVIRPTAHVAIDNRLALRAAGMIGPTYSTIGEDKFIGGNIESALGLHYGFAVGVRLALSDSAGLDLELAVTKHSAEHEVDTILGNIEIDGEVTQYFVTVGAYFDLTK